MQCYRCLSIYFRVQWRFLKMSSADLLEVFDEMMMMYCASCGTTANDDIKLKKCTACHLVRYCSVKCQKDHRPHHKKECKKRAAELHDELLFTSNPKATIGGTGLPHLFPTTPALSTKTHNHGMLQQSNLQRMRLCQYITRDVAKAGSHVLLSTKISALRIDQELNLCQ